MLSDTERERQNPAEKSFAIRGEVYITMSSDILTSARLCLVKETGNVNGISARKYCYGGWVHQVTFVVNMFSIDAIIC